MSQVCNEQRALHSINTDTSNNNSGQTNIPFDLIRNSSARFRLICCLATQTRTSTRPTRPKSELKLKLKPREEICWCCNPIDLILRAWKRRARQKHFSTLVYVTSAGSLVARECIRVPIDGAVGLARPIFHTTTTWVLLSCCAEVSPLPSTTKLASSFSFPSTGLGRSKVCQSLIIHIGSDVAMLGKCNFRQQCRLQIRPIQEFVLRFSEKNEGNFSLLVQLCCAINLSKGKTFDSAQFRPRRRQLNCNEDIIARLLNNQGKVCSWKQPN